jgi:hypothetical protein
MMSQVLVPAAAYNVGRSRWLFAFAILCSLWPALSALAQSPPPGLAPPAKPTAMPAFELPTTAGNPLRSDALRGQVVVIRFWASW